VSASEETPRPAPARPKRTAKKTAPPAAPEQSTLDAGVEPALLASAIFETASAETTSPAAAAPTAAATPQYGGAVSAPAASDPGVKVSSSTDSLDLQYLLQQVVTSGGSDLHLSVGAPPLIRVSGDMRPVPGWPRLTGRLLRTALFDAITEDQRLRFERDWELDFALTLPNGNRYRGNLMMQRGDVGAVFRSVPTEIVPLDALGMPNVLYNLAALPRGLVLVTGPTGSGKSTTLAALIDQINRTRQGHIVTVEDPIEFVHRHRACVVNQREVGGDTKSFTSALKHVLRQDPDVILIGELRDLETISIALTAAETGHLVFATLHTQSAQDTVSRVIDVFPSGQQQQIRSQLAATLKGVVCQTLVKRADGQGRVPASEIMVVNPAIATQIRRDETHQIPQALQSGARLGMHSLNQNLASLVNDNIITREAAETVASDLKELENLISGQAARNPQGSATTTDHKPGDVVNGYVLSDDGKEWLPQNKA